MKKGFTLAETVITVAVIGIVAAVAIPIMHNNKADKDVIMYSKALSAIQSAMTPVAEKSFEIAASQPGYNINSYRAAAFLSNSKSRYVCEAIAANLNTTGEIRCNQAEIAMSFDSPDFVTTDGLRFWHVGGPDNWSFAGGDGQDDILVDYDLTEADKKRRLQLRYPNANDRPNWSNTEYGLRITIHSDGRVSVPDEERNSYELFLIDNSMKIKAER